MAENKEKQTKKTTAKKPKVEKEPKKVVEEETVEVEKETEKIDETIDNAKKVITEVLETEDKSDDFTKKETEDGKGMAILSYIIALIPYYMEKENKFVRFHARQGMDIFIVSLVLMVISRAAYFMPNILSWIITIPVYIINIILFVISVMGIINAINGKAKELPLISKIKIFK